MDISEIDIDEYIFSHPFTAMIAGPTQSGKSTFVRRILEYNQTMIKPAPTRMVYCYALWQDGFNQLKLIWPAIEFVQGIVDIENLNSKDNNLIILDDLMKQCQKDETVVNLFTTDSHHRNISVFFITQNLFDQGKFCRTISLNCHYMIILNNPRDRTQIEFLGRQMFPRNSKFLVECYDDATTVQYGYIFLDLKQSTNPKIRVQTSIMPDQQRIIYEQKSRF